MAPAFARQEPSFNMKKLKFIFTSDEEVLDSIHTTLAKHPKVTHVFQDSGFWYTNGETGPEWFSMHVCFDEPNKEAVEKFIEETLASKGTSARLILERDSQ